jgi:hypothetical protein
VVAFTNLIQDVLGTIPGMNRGLAAARINEALTAIQDENIWNFQIITGGWLTANLLGGPTVYGGYGTGPYNYGPYGGGSPQDTNQTTGFLSPGTITVIPFTNTIIGDAVATATWLAAVPYPPLLTQQQIRVPTYSLYSIIALGSAPTLAYVTIDTPGFNQTPGIYLLTGTGGSGQLAQIYVTVNDNGTVTIPPIVVNPGFGYATNGIGNPPTFTLAAGGTPATLTAVLNAQVTIDRPWMEPQQTNGSYLVYQAYYPAPPGFRRFWQISDYTNNAPMDFTSMSQADLTQEDPQRTIFGQPGFVVPFGPDTRQGSATYGQFLFELWPGPTQQLPYNFQCECNLPPLVNPNDTLPWPLTEELVRQRAYEMCCLWKEGTKGDDMERGSGANWQFLAKAYHEEYVDRLKRIRIMDRNMSDLYLTKARRDVASSIGDGDYTGNTANVGWFER